MTIRAVAALALLAFFALAPTPFSLGGVALAQEADSEATVANICDRTPQVRKAILAKLPDVNDCAAVTDAHLSGITGTFPIEYGSIVEFKDGDFRGLINVNRLEVDSVFRGSTLPSGVFDGLTSLKQLVFSKNYTLTSLPADVFDTVPNLTHLYMDQNLMLPQAGLLSGLSKLEHLDLSGNHVSTLDEDAFNGLSSLKHLNLAYNGLEALPEDVFDGLSSLEELDLQDNQLNEFPEDVFDGLSKLRELELRYNGLSTLPEDVFEGTPELRMLNIEWNWGLEGLPADVFEGLTKLEYLNLGYNHMMPLHADLFDDLISLHTLSLEGTMITWLPGDVFEGPSNMRILHLDYTRLSYLPSGMFKGLTRLFWLDLHSNPGSPFKIVVELEQRGDDSFVLKVAQGVPIKTKVMLSAEGGTLSRSEVTIPAGHITSEPISVAPSGESPTEVTVSVDKAQFKLTRRLRGREIPILFTEWGGVALKKGEPLTLLLTSTPDPAPDPSPTPMPVNTPATGAPTISGTAQVGEALAADTSGIADADGLTGVTYGYQWIANDGNADADIQGATGSTYALVADDEGKTLKVRVSFTDDAGHEESLASAATAVVIAATPTGICDRTQQVRDGILALLPDVTDCAAVTDALLTGITENLVLANKGMTGLKSGDFQGLANLQELHLSSNSLTSLPEDVFDGLANLEWLILSDNNLSSLPEDVFQGLTTLGYLYLSGNNLSSLPEDVFQGLFRQDRLANHLDLSENELDELPADLFDGLLNLNFLDLSENELSELRADLFDDPSNLVWLYLDDNDLSELPADVFDGLTDLNTLRLGHNNLSELPADVFDGLTSLMSLHVEYNNLTELPAELFNGLSKLENLKLSGNKLSELPADVFDGLASLQYLHLSGNNLSELPADVFHGLTGLEHLHLNGNNLSELPDGLFEGLSELDRLYLNDNPGAPFTLTAELERQGDDAVAVKVAEGSPFDMDVGLSVEGGTLSSPAGKVDGGKTASDAITVTPAGNGQAQVVISVESAEFDEDDYEFYYGVQIGVGEPLVLGSAVVVNTPATGAPTISGTAQVGETLAANTSGIVDADGLTGVAYSYQWIANDGSADADIQGASGSTYALVPADEGKTLKVRVSFTDDTGHDETLTSAATAVVIAATPTGICDRTAQVRDGILALLPGVTDCGLVTDSDLAGVTGSLPLINQEIARLKSGDFQGLANLQDLRLEHNSLTALPADVFDGLTSLNTLYLEHNSLTALPTDMFTHLPALELLDFGENEFTALPADAFAGAASLERLILDNNHLLSLPEGVFDGLANLKSLDLQHNKNADGSKALASLPEGALDDLVKLEALLLQDNALTTLPGVAHLGELKELRLQDNALATLPDDAFSGLVKLEELRLDDNKLTSLPAGVFTGLVKLDELQLQNNRLRSLPDGVFAGLSSLEHLYLHENKLNALRGNAFRGLGALQLLALFDNKLRTLPDGLFEGLSGLNIVWFNDNTGAPFTLTPVLKQDRSTYEIVVRVAQGAPADMVFTLSVSKGGALSKYTVTIEAGSLASEGVTLSRSGVRHRVFTVSVESAVFVDTGRDEDGREKLDGFEIGRAGPLSANLAPGQRGEEEEPAGSGPTAAVALSPPTVPVGAEIAVTMSFSNLESDSDASTKDYVFRADVKDSNDGTVDQCEEQANGYGLGVDRYMYKVDEDPEVRTGTISADCPAGGYTLRASISSPDGVELASASAGFSIVNVGPPLSNDATLSGLALSGVDIGTFDPAATTYTAEVANDVAQTTVTPTVNDDDATYVIKLGGAADTDGVIPLAVGSNVITVEVTAENAITTKTYTVTVTRAAPPSDDATLSNLALSDIDFGTFDPATTGYSASVANDVAQTIVTPTLNDDGASYVVKLDGAVDGDGTVTLAVGSNVITIEVTAENGITTKTYTVTVTRAASGPTVSVALSPSGSVEPGTEITVTMSFANLEADSDTSDTDYIFRADVRNSGGEAADQCENQDGGYGLGVERYMYKVDEDPEVRKGTISADCPAGDYTVRASVSSPDNVELASGSADFTVNAPEAQQQTSEPQLSTDATLSALTLSSVDIGTFDPATTDYTASVGNDVAETTVTATVNDGGASYIVKLDGVEDADGTVPLSVGGNVTTIEITAEDGQTTKTYTVTVTRAAPPLSTDATLSALALSGIDIGAFDSATTGYTASVDNDVTGTTVTATVNDGGAAYAIKLDGAEDADGTVDLAVGGNVITIEVTAQDGQTTRTYTITITRAEAPASDDAILSSLTLSGIDISTFDSAVTEYTASVGNDVAQTTVTATTNDGGAAYAIKLDGAEDTDRTVDLAVGENFITIEVTAEDRQTTRTYTVTVTRAKAVEPEPAPEPQPVPDSPPDAPDKPAGEVAAPGQVKLDWNDVEGAAYYRVGFWDVDEWDWVELPTGDIEIDLDGSSATITKLPKSSTYWFSVRAGNAAGLSDWSGFLTLGNPYYY